MADVPEPIIEIVERFDVSACRHAQADRNRDGRTRTTIEHQIAVPDRQTEVLTYGLKRKEISGIEEEESDEQRSVLLLSHLVVPRTELRLLA